MHLPMKLCTSKMDRSSRAQLQHLPKMLVTFMEDKLGASACVKTFVWAILFVYVKKWWKWLICKNICYLRTLQAKMRHWSHSPCLLPSCCVTARTSLSSAKYPGSNTRRWNSLIAQKIVGHIGAHKLQKPPIKVIVSRAKCFLNWERQRWHSPCRSPPLPRVCMLSCEVALQSATSRCVSKCSLKRTCLASWENPLHHLLCKSASLGLPLSFCITFLGAADRLSGRVKLSWGQLKKEAVSICTDFLLYFNFALNTFPFQKGWSKQCFAVTDTSSK